MRVRAYDTCGDDLGCSYVTFAPWQRAGTFAEYFEGMKRNRPEHLEGYGERWDSLQDPKPPPWK